MTAITDKQKGWLELAADILCVVILADIVWVNFFQQAPPVKQLHDLIAILGTAALCWLGWKMLRRNKAVS